MSYRVRSTKRHSALTVVIPILIVCGMFACILTTALSKCGNILNGSSESAPTLRLAYSSDKESVFSALIDRFLATNPKLPDGQAVTLEGESLSSDKIVETALLGSVQVISPDSSLWLSELDRRWAEQQGTDTYLVGDSTRYMVSPIVIAMWSDIAESLGYPQSELGWADLLRAAQENPQFKWSHPSAGTASGLLTTLAIFYAGAGITRGLDEATATAPQTIAYVSELEKTVSHYGEAEEKVIQQVEAQGRSYLDAFVIQEQLLVQYNIAHPSSLVAVYPVEGTLWADHPLALLELPDLTDDQRLAYDLFKQFLLSTEVQQYLLSEGYRPADLEVKLDSAGSVLTKANGVDSAQPYTTLQVPNSEVVDVVLNAWAYTKRPANIYLVADVSGSMEGDKLASAQEALSAFIQQIPNDTERVGLIAFSSSAREVVPLTMIGTGREQLEQAISGLSANGNTALLDGVSLGFTKLQDLDDRERINAIVVMTDGKENNSVIRLSSLTRELEAASKSSLPVLVFCIAYGEDAELQPLESMAQATGAFARSSGTTDISDLYKTLSTYF
ncbi:MAG: VWA domain-containing protein [Chloroflexi bacterium]|nr:VWA domain-containing protein [Chloroflexota bacterium]